MPVHLRTLAAPLDVGSTVGGGYVVRELDESNARIVLGRQSDGRILAVELRPRDPARPCFTWTHSLNVNYVAGAPMAADEMVALRRLASVLRANDRGEPFTRFPAVERTTLPIAVASSFSTVTGDSIFLRIGSTCEMECSFCTRGRGGNLSKPRPLSASAAHEAEIEAAGARGLRTLVLGGDEPMSHPALVSLLRRARSVGFERIEIVTSGLRLRERDVARALRADGVTHVHLPLYGATAAVHESVTGAPGSFDAVLRAADVARAEGIEVLFHSILLRTNLGEAVALRDLLAMRYDSGVGFAHLEPRSEDAADYRANMPSYREIVQTLRGARVLLNGFPLCVAHAAGADTPNAAPRAGEDRPAFAHLGRLKPEPCRRCSWEPHCPGTYAKYVEAWGTDGLLPHEADSPAPLGGAIES